MSGKQATLNRTLTGGLINNNQEIELLDRQRQMFGLSSSDYYQQPNSSESGGGGSYYDQKNDQNQKNQKGKKGKAKRGILMGLIGVGLPGMLAGGILLSGFKGVLTLQHILDSISDVRFGHSSRQLSKRFQHISKIYNVGAIIDSSESITFPDGSNEKRLKNKLAKNINRSGNGSLFHKMLRITPEHAYADLIERGYKFEYNQKGRFLGISNKPVLAKIIDPNGNEIDLTKSSTTEKVKAIRNFSKQSEIDGNGRWWRKQGFG